MVEECAPLHQTQERRLEDVRRLQLVPIVRRQLPHSATPQTTHEMYSRLLPEEQHTIINELADNQAHDLAEVAARDEFLCEVNEEVSR